MTPSRFGALKVLFPSAVINSRAKGVVGPAGLDIGYVSGFKACNKHYEPGETVPLLKIEEQELRIDIGIRECVKKVSVSHEMFSDFVV